MLLTKPVCFWDGKTTVRCGMVSLTWLKLAKSQKVFSFTSFKIEQIIVHSLVTYFIGFLKDAFVIIFGSWRQKRYLLKITNLYLANKWNKLFSIIFREFVWSLKDNHSGTGYARGVLDQIKFTVKSFWSQLRAFAKFLCSLK